MKASDFIARYIEARGVTHIYELVGGMITHLLDSFSRHSDIRIICCHHEQAAGFAAEGHARISGLPGIALATSGPGATNLLTALGSCYFDSTPAVFITGQVNTHELKKDRKIRQLGFQETDIVSVATPICKSAIQVARATDLPEALENAFSLATEGRQGPCLLDIPMNVQAESIDEDTARKWIEKATTDRPEYGADQTNESISRDRSLKQEFSRLLLEIEKAERPILLMGGGCAAVASREAALTVAELLGVPVVLSLMAVDVLPGSHPLRVGFIGSYGNRWANKALGAADLLIVVGSRLDIRQTGSDIESFCAGKQIWQVDIDEDEIGVRVQPHHRLVCTVECAASELTGLPQKRVEKHAQWHKEISTLRHSYPPALEYKAEPGEMNPVSLLRHLSEYTPSPCQYITDVGQHQMWAAQSLGFDVGDRFLTSGGMGAMGFGLPAAIGAACARPDLMTILISGDGSFQLNIQELETAKRNNLNLKIVLFNNRCHGMVRQFQESYFDDRLQSTVVGYSAPDFVALGLAYGLATCRIESTNDISEALAWMLKQAGPTLLEIPLSKRSKVYPKLAFGRRFGEMEPESLPVAMEST